MVEFNHLAFTHSFNSLKREWNWNTLRYKAVVQNFAKGNLTYDRERFGAELPQINLLTNNAVIQIMNNLYDISKVSFIYKPTIYSADETLQAMFDDYAKFIHVKTLGTNTNFVTTIKQMIEDGFVYGLGAMLVVPKGKDLSFMSIKPEYMEFDVDPSTKVPNRFFITLLYDEKSPNTFVFMEVFKTDAPTDYEYHKGTYLDSLKLGKNTPTYMSDTHWTIRTWYRDRQHNKFRYHKETGMDKSFKLRDYGHHDNDYHPPMWYDTEYEYTKNFANAAYYSYSSEDYHLDYCPVIYTRFNVKSNEVVGLGVGLESISLITEVKNLYNALRVSGAYDINKSLTATQMDLNFSHEGDVKTLQVNEDTSVPVVVTRDNLQGSTVPVRYLPLEMNSNPNTTFALLNKATTALTQAFEIDRLLVTQPIEMTATEVTARNDRDKKYIDVYVNEFRLAFDVIFRLCFDFYMNEFVHLNKYTLTKLGLSAGNVDVLKQWKVHAFDEGVLEIQFLNNSEREIAQQKIADLTQMVSLEAQIMQMATQANIDPTKVLKVISDNFVNLGLGNLNLLQGMEKAQPQPMQQSPYNVYN